MKIYWLYVGYMFLIVQANIKQSLSALLDRQYDLHTAADELKELPGNCRIVWVIMSYLHLAATMLA